MNIEELVNRYFEGETSCQEEQELRRFFSQESIPEHLQLYRPLFACIEQEAKKSQFKSNKKILPLHRKLFYTLSGVAAGILLLIYIGNIQGKWQINPENYVIIDGKQYTDNALIREQALAAFCDIRTSEEEVFDLLFE